MCMRALKSIFKRLRIIPRDFSYGGEDYKRMIEANAARNEESGINNSRWAPGALNRLENKRRWDNMKSHWRSWWHN